MGWKLNMIVLKGLKDTKLKFPNVIGTSYGRRSYTKSGKCKLSDCLNPKDDGKLYLGIYKDLYIITEANLPFEFLNSEPTLTEKLWGTFTNDDRISYAFALNSVINLWGYSILNQKKRLRVKFGNHDEGVIHEEGIPLASEQELLENSKLVNGKRIYSFRENEYQEDQMGEEFVFRIIEEVTGERLDKTNELLDIEMEVYDLLEKKGFEDIFKVIRERAKKNGM